MLAFLMFIFAQSFSLMAQQNSSEQLKYAIESALNSTNDTTYSVKYIYTISPNVENNNNYFPVKDPYGTLSSSTFFSAKSAIGNWIFGLFKEPQILFRESISEYCDNVYFNGSLDLNKNNKVNLIVGCSTLRRSENDAWVSNSSFYIVSWDGQNIELVNDIDVDGNSIIRSNTTDYLEILDIDGDNIYELITKKEQNNDLIERYWKWDGTKYSSVSIPDEEGIFFTANACKGQVKAAISFNENVFQYSYKIISSVDSKKPIQEFLLSHIGTDTTGSSPENWTLSGGGRSEYLIKWHTTNEEDYIKPGDSLDNFILYSDNLPSVQNGYLRSKHPLPKTNKPGFSLEKYFQDQKENSFQIKILTPWLPDSSISPQDFTDTLETFRYRSCEELNWVTNHGVCNSLEVKIRNVKRHIESGKTKQAANVLRAFLNEVKAQRGKHITEEGYALLYFNARYIRNQINDQVED